LNRLDLLIEFQTISLGSNEGNIQLTNRLFSLVVSIALVKSQYL